MPTSQMDCVSSSPHLEKKHSAELTKVTNERDGLQLQESVIYPGTNRFGLLSVWRNRCTEENSPTIFNKIGRHQSKLVRTKVCSNKVTLVGVALDRY